VSDVLLKRYETVIEATHGAAAKLLARENVRGSFGGHTVWEGEVLVFGLLDHPAARLCYAWELDGRVTTILAKGRVKSAQDAVAASVRRSRSRRR
jgi:hypothetical protein